MLEVVAVLEDVPRLADQQRYIASEATFYRILKAEKQLAHRRSERPAHARSKPRSVCADAPNQLYSWDITYLPTTIRGQYFYLYLFLDVFARSSAGRSMRRKAARSPAKSSGTFAHAKRYSMIR